MISENIVDPIKFQFYLKRENSQLTAGNRDDCLASSTIFRRRGKERRAWCIYHSFWQIERRRATRGIGFSQKIDFLRVVVRLALAGGFTAADPISLPLRFSISPLSLRVTQSPLRQATANWTCPAHCCCIHSWYGLTYNLSRGNCVGGATHSRLCVPYFYPLRAARWNCTQFPLPQHTRDALYPLHIRTHRIATAFVGWERSYHTPSNFSLFYL